MAALSAAIAIFFGYVMSKTCVAIDEWRREASPLVFGLLKCKKFAT